jgi:ParB/RepB/Spo0J family partition protein
MARHQKVESIFTDGINVKPNPLRSLDGEEVKRLAASMQRIGLMTPVTVRFHEGVPTEDGKWDDSYELIAGRHRLAAAISLGWEEIDAIEIECSDVDAKLWEIAENLHRAELTKLEHDEQVALWIKLTDEKESLSGLRTNPKGGRPGGISAAAREIGVKKTSAHEAIKVASLSDEAKAAAVKHHLDDNRSALLEAANESGPKAQVAKLVERAAKPKVTVKPAPPIDEALDDAPEEPPELKAARAIIWPPLPEGKSKFFREHRQVLISGKRSRWVTLIALKAAVLAGTTKGWMVAEHDDETGEMLSWYCPRCTVDRSEARSRAVQT